MRRRSARTGLWRHPDFVRLWAAETVSIFGSLVTRTALPFTAILTLDATPLQIAALRVADLVPGFLAGLVAGAWVDRWPRRPILIAADLGRAGLLLLIPAAALADVLNLELLLVVAFATGVLTTFFDVAYQSYLPTLVRREDLVEGNSKLTASASVAEFGAFGLGGWLVQILTGPIAILLDALSFLWSAAFVWRIQTPEPPPAPLGEREPLRREVGEGLRLIARDPLLRPLAATAALLDLSFSVFGAVFLLYTTRTLDLSPGVQGMIFAVGGVSSLLGALVAGRLTARFGIGPTMIGALLLGAVGQLLIPLAPAVAVVAVAVLVGQQIVGDGAITVKEIAAVSLRQAVAPERVLGRVNGSIRFLGFGAMLVGTLLGGVLGETVGLRPTLALAGLCLGLAALILYRSPVRAVRDAPVVLPPADATPITAP